MIFSNKKNIFKFKFKFMLIVNYFVMYKENAISEFFKIQYSTTIKNTFYKCRTKRKQRIEERPEAK